MMKTATAEEKKEILLRILQRYSHLSNPLFHSHFERLSEESTVITQIVENEQFITIFISHNTTALFHTSDHSFSLQGTPRFFKSVLIDAADNIVSIGLPHFFSLQSFPETAQAVKWSESWRFIEKHDGTCLLVTRYKGRYLVRSRRRIYRISDSLEFLDFADYHLGEKVEALFSKYKDQSVTVITEAVFPRQIKPETLTDFYRRDMRGANPWSYVAYPGQDNFLTGIVFHDNIHIEKQLVLDEIAVELGLKRPATLSFPDMREAKKWVKRANNHEGFCVYFNDDQSVFKLKTSWYIQVRDTVAELFHLLA